MVLLGAAFILLAAAVVFFYALVTRRLVLARGVPAVAVILAATYLRIMLTFSFKSKQVLALGQEKHFCEIDCHLAYSILDVHRAKRLGSPPNQTTTAGNFLCDYSAA